MGETYTPVLSQNGCERGCSSLYGKRVIGRGQGRTFDGTQALLFDGGEYSC